MFEARSETSVGNCIFWSEIGSGFGEAGGTPPPEYPPPRAPQLSMVHHLNTEKFDITINSIPLERVTSTKLLGSHIHEHLNWEGNVRQVAASCYATLVKEHPAFPYQKEFGTGTGSKQAILQ